MPPPPMLPSDPRTTAASELVEFDGELRLVTPLPCRECGYNLKTQFYSARCPECGMPVANSILLIRERIDRRLRLIKAAKTAVKRTLIGLCVVFAVYLVMCIEKRTGFQVSPDTLRSRRFTYWAFTPFGARIQLSDIAYAASTGSPTQEYLLAQGLIKAAPDASVRWWTMGHHSSLRGLHHRYFEAINAHRVKWSKDNPALAKEVWSAALEFIRHGSPTGWRYAEQLLGMAEGGLSIEDLRKDIEIYRNDLLGIPEEDYTE